MAPNNTYKENSNFTFTTSATDGTFYIYEGASRNNSSLLFNAENSLRYNVSIENGAIIVFMTEAGKKKRKY